jgi:predicted amino acid-binding ACT domain protein
MPQPAPRALIIRAPGTNCDEETSAAWERAGAKPETWHVGRLLEAPHALDDFSILTIPGGFSYGDDLGAGRILVQEIDGYPVEVTGNLHTIVLVAEDRKGSIARITGILAEHDINIATLRLTRKERGGDAFMVIECDEVPDKAAGAELRSLGWVRWTRRLDKVSGG